VYLFNLQEGEYYISQVSPIVLGAGRDKGNPCDKIIKMGDGAFIYTGDDKTADPLLLASSCSELVFSKDNFMAFPIKVNKGKLSVYGNYKIKRKRPLRDSVELI